jgi:hypothetical protein
MGLSSVRLLSRGTTLRAAGGWALSWPAGAAPGPGRPRASAMPAAVPYTVALAPRESRATLGQHPRLSRRGRWPQLQVEGAPAMLAGSTRSDWPLCVCGRGRRSRVVILPRCCQYGTLDLGWASSPPGPKQTPERP